MFNSDLDSVLLSIPVYLKFILLHICIGFGSRASWFKEMYWKKLKSYSYLLCYLFWWLEKQKSPIKQENALQNVSNAKDTMVTFFGHTYVQEPVLNMKAEFISIARISIPFPNFWVVHIGILGILVGHTEKPLSRPYSKIFFQEIHRTIFNWCDPIND